MHNLTEDGNQTVTVVAEFQRDGFAKSRFHDKRWMIGFNSMNSKIASCFQTAEYFNASQFEANGDKLVIRRELLVNGNLVGKTGVDVVLTPVDEFSWNASYPEYMEVRDSNTVSSALDVWVTRNEHGKRLTKIFVSTLIVSSCAYGF
ncbi:hypothetical protein L596_000669 [Steinernema carpocapsae]|uniref:Uncharacterized protein n=1 Tax=Steinernema carpocapsae TaxID=34508 RepID=A0A4U8UJ45_STECR|nr:hypothetical protein L596_000669 [Steinernema carpocapsae]